MKLFVWLKNVWYIVTLVVSVELWSMRAKPPSPLSAETQLPYDPVIASVPLSCVPPMVMN
jgi:hypothetical protein